jgi:hypothetical protein
MILLAVNVCAPHDMVIIKQGTPKINAFLMRTFAEVVQIEPYKVAIDNSPRNSI